MEHTSLWKLTQSCASRIVRCELLLLLPAFSCFLYAWL